MFAALLSVAVMTTEFRVQFSASAQTLTSDTQQYYAEWKENSII